MTQEEKLQEAKRLYKTANSDQRYVLESLFPELKESEYERIRKALIKYFTLSDDNADYQCCGVHYKDIVAWLEKQREQTISENYKQAEKEKRDAVGYGFMLCKGDILDFKEGESYWLEYIGDDKYNVRSDNLLGKTYHLTPMQFYLCFRPLTWLEKQGDTSEIVNKKKIASDILRGAAINLITWIDYNAAEGNMCLSNMECKDIEDALVSGDWDKIYAYIKKKLEKQGEQKPVNDTDEDIVEAVKDTSILDLVEPKFHEGEWVVQEKIGVYKVIEVCESWYEVVDNKDKHYSIGFDKEYMCHLWTIQDAKDGDVLVSRYNKPFIYNGNRDSFHIGSYCGISVEDWFKVATEKCHWTENVNIHPADKEQRDTLFAKMKKAGYEWDADKKELKEIKIITPLFNVGDTIIKKNNSDINKFGQFTITDITGGKYWYNDRIICDISEQYEWELVEKKPISFDTSTPVSYDDIPFGEKDYELHEATYFIPEGFHAEIEGDKVIIKRGEQKPAWSEEDERICRVIICDIANDKSICKFEISKSICDEQINWLKSLKERIGG